MIIHLFVFNTTDLILGVLVDAFTYTATSNPFHTLALRLKTHIWMKSRFSSLLQSTFVSKCTEVVSDSFLSYPSPGFYPPPPSCSHLFVEVEFVQLRKHPAHAAVSSANQDTKCDKLLEEPQTTRTGQDMF